MGNPLILANCLPIVNWSFEGSTTGWTGAGTVTTAAAHSAGEGLPSAYGLATGTVTQDLDLTDVPAWAKDGAVQWALACMVSGSGTSSVSGTGIAQGTAVNNGSGTWKLRVVPFTATSAATAVTISVTGGNADRVFCGLLIDTAKGWKALDYDIDSGVFANEGDGTVELVRVRRPRTRIDIDVDDIVEGTAYDAPFKVLSKAISSGKPGPIALWQDRELFTNAERHFQLCYHDPKLKIEYKPGVTRRRYSFRFTAVSEGA